MILRCEIFRALIMLGNCMTEIAVSLGITIYYVDLEQRCFIANVTLLNICHFLELIISEKLF